MRVTKEEFTGLLNKQKNLKEQIKIVRETAEKKVAVITGRLAEVDSLIARVKVDEEEN
ncbi:hypothetical protein I6E31_00700 [Fusobacterium varium]|uniref:hypothetical protein n=1 Tax=Fusobacterium sp. SB021 TaxID=2744227 RepID=UPI0015A10ED1|nr:hypothetical protein [Fusobacterium varium]